jgi:hypothetical protein
MGSEEGFGGNPSVLLMKSSTPSEGDGAAGAD